MAQNVLAVVAGHQITEEELQAFIGHLPKEQQAYASNPQFKEHCKEQLITFHALAKCGEDEKLDETEEYRKGMENARQDILVQMVLKETIESVSVSDEEVKDYYEQNKAQFVKGATVNAKHILTDSEEKCAAILESIVNGEKTFEEAAKESSTCPSGAQGGDLGEFGKGQMVKEFEDAAFQAEPGHVVGPVKTQFGYHLIKVEKKNEAKEAGFADKFMGTGQQAKFIGHGIGLEINEAPVLAPRMKQQLEPGMVFALEPKIVIPSVGPVGIENSWVVTNEGIEKLTNCNEEIIELS